MPDFRDYAVDVPAPGSVQAADAHELGVFLRDVARLNRTTGMPMPATLIYERIKTLI